MKTRSLVSLMTLALTAVCAFSFTASNKQKASPVSANSGVALKQSAGDYPYIDDTLPLTDNDNLFITIDNITKTSSGESFTFSFSANTILYPVGTTGTNKYIETTGVYVTPYDENYPSKSKLADLIKYDVDFYDPDDPNIVRDDDGNIVYEPDGRPKCADGHGFSYEMPSYTAFLSMIDTATFKKKGIETIVVPYSITYGSWFTLLVKGINAGCIMNTATGGERYNNIKSVVIGENIETIADGAFDNCPDDFAVRTTLSEKPTDWADDFIDGGTVEYNYLPSDHEKEIFDTSEQRDEDGNLIYYDDKGARVDSEGYYLDEEGNRIEVIDQDGNKTYLHYDGELQTTYASFRFKAGNYKNLESEKNFLLGMIDNDRGYNYPLLMVFDVIKEDGVRYERVFECPLNNASMFTYDAVGSLAGMYSLTKIVDVRLLPGEEIDFNSVKFYNIFEAIRDTSSETFAIKPNTEVAYRGIPSLAITRKNNIEDFFDVKFDSVKTVFGYTSINLKFDCVDDAYLLVKEKKYREKEEGILDGTYKIRYSLRGFKAASYAITTKDNEPFTVKFGDSVGGGIPGELDYHVMTSKNNNSITFLLQDGCIGNGFNANSLESIEICGFNVTLDICPTKKGTTQVLSQSSASFRFGFLELLPEDMSGVKPFNGNLFLILYFVIYFIVYLAGVGGYYAYARAAYKNDEFRRMNTKAYIKRVSVGFIGATFIVGAIAFIILRFALISPTIAVFNPMDPLVIVFGVGGIISLGFFIKFLVVTIKQEKVRRRNIKLRLGEDADDDGTK